ncbi:hypothetical protein HYN48_14420 [Flavobacterium magnum]|uniref:DUF7660 domain-containing protein n=2 Tax=Flavobacterium magnum TaxID=2162713 RepID=A0A2S0RLC5_9FLAO|nr:hypothetical protein HYN48_14420 [Flavobacterium magnum]
MDTRIEATKNIRTRQDFIVFLNELLLEYRANGPEWENNNLENFLSALADCAEGIDGFYANTQPQMNAEEASWKIFADILMSARIYE